VVTNEPVCNRNGLRTNRLAFGRAFRFLRRLRLRAGVVFADRDLTIDQDRPTVFYGRITRLGEVDAAPTVAPRACVCHADKEQAFDERSSNSIKMAATFSAVRFSFVLRHIASVCPRLFAWDGLHRSKETLSGDRRDHIVRPITDQ